MSDPGIHLDDILPPHMRENVMATEERLENAIKATDAAVMELEFARVDAAAALLETALKECYAIRKESAPLVDLSGQGR